MTEQFQIDENLNYVKYCEYKNGDIKLACFMKDSIKSNMIWRALLTANGRFWSYSTIGAVTWLITNQKALSTGPKMPDMGPRVWTDMEANVPSSAQSQVILKWRGCAKKEWESNWS